MAGAHDRLVDAVEAFRGEPAQVVLEGLELELDVRRPVAHPEPLPQGLVLIGQFVDAVIVGVEAQPQHPEHEDRPLRHAGPPGVRADLALPLGSFGERLFEAGEDALAHVGIEVEVLQSTQNPWDVVAGFGVEDAGRNVDLAERQLGFDDFAQGISRRRSFSGAGRSGYANGLLPGAKTVATGSNDPARG
jgi:hypothetical protein